MPVRILDWSNYAANGIDLVSGTTAEADGVAVTFEFLEQDEGAVARNLALPQYAAPGEPWDTTQGLKLLGEGGEGGIDDTSTTTLTFSSVNDEFGDNVQDVLFRVNDLDTGQQGQDFTDIITIRAFDEAGNEVPVDLTPGALVETSGQTGTGNDVGDPIVTPPTDPDKSLLVSIVGPVARIEIDYDNAGPDQQAAWLTDIKFETTDAEGGGLNGIVDGDDDDNLIDLGYDGDPEGDRIDNDDQILPGEERDDDIVQARGGDDTVLAGEGNDDVFGDTGDDVISGEDGDDILRGEEGNDTVFGNDGDDTIETDSGNLDALDAETFVGVPVDEFPDDDRDSVEGGAGDDLIINTGDDADTVDGGTGNDTIDTGIDDDVIEGGDGNDSIDGGQGADTIFGDAGDDTIIAGSDLFSDYVGDDPNLPDPRLIDPATGEPALSDPNTEDNRDFVGGGDGNDFIETGDDADAISGGAGDDTIDAGIDDDNVTGGAGNDSIIGGHGSDVVNSGIGDDFVDTSSDILVLPDEGYDDPSGVPVDPVPENDRDFVEAVQGNDTILTGDDDDTIRAGSGNDVVNAGIDDDEVTGASGDDSLIGGEGDDFMTGDLGNDTLIGDTGIYGDEIPNDGSDPEPTNNEDTLFGGDGNDMLRGGDDDDVLNGGLGNDTLDGGVDDDELTGLTGDDLLIGGEGDDTVIGGVGNDTLSGGPGVDDMQGGQDRDVFRDVGAGDTVDGATTGDDFDTLNLNGAGDFEFTSRTVDPDGDSTSGVINLLNSDGSSRGQVNFLEIENIIPCFTPGTVIATPRGERLVEDLQIGDRVITRDNGLQEIRWVGKRALNGAELAAAPNLRPVLIRAGALGHGLPERDLLVSPQHRVLMASERAALYFEEREVLAAAKHLTDLEGVDVVDANATTYIHFMCDQHEVVLSNGSWTESFQPGDQVMDGMGTEQRDEIYALFPELREKEGLDAYHAARRSLKKHEARLLAAK